MRTVGSVLAAPRAPLARRFGAMLLLRLDQALGEVEEAVSPRLPVPVLSVERHLAEPIGLVEDIERLVPMLARSLKRDLERRGEGARLFELLLFRVDGAVSRIAARASPALREPALIYRLFAKGWPRSAQRSNPATASISCVFRPSRRRRSTRCRPI